MQFQINTFPWGKPQVAPVSTAEIVKLDDKFQVKMCSYEKNIKATISTDNGEVYKDSCLEFFFSPMPDSRAYFNFEINPLGALYIGFSPTGNRIDSKPVDFSDYKSMIMPGAMLDYDNDFWEVSFNVPYCFIKNYFPEFNPDNTSYIKGNFYKCGDETIYPHFAVWSNIDTTKVTKPNFHVAEYFRKIAF